MISDAGIFILGAGIMQIPALKIGREMGLYVVAADGNPAAEGREICHKFFNIDLKEKEKLLDAVKSLPSTPPIKGVLTAGTDFSANVAWLAEKLGLPGIPYQVAQNASDKGRMRSCFAKAGLSSPRFATLSSPEELKNLELSPPLVVKPVDNMGSRGVVMVKTPEELPKAVREAIRYSRTERVIVEEYIDGPEFSLDALVYRGRVIPCGCADRHITFSPYFVEMGHTMPSSFPSKIQGEIWELFKRGIRSLGIDQGAAKGDIKLSKSGPVLGEIAARLSGGFMSGWTYPYASAREVTAGAIRISLGLSPDLPRKDRGLVSAERAFISIPGRIRRINGIREAEQLQGIKNVFVLKKEGSPVDFPVNNVGKVGNVISQGRGIEKTKGFCEEAVRKIEIHLEPGEETTRKFLFSQERSWPPYAYNLQDPENLKFLKEIPWIRFPGEGEVIRGLHILPLPDLERENCVDWIGRGLKETFMLVQHRAGTFPVPESGALILGKVFWRAFLSGGMQGGIWVLETIKQNLKFSDFRERIQALWEI